MNKNKRLALIVMGIILIGGIYYFTKTKNDRIDEIVTQTNSFYKSDILPDRIPSRYVCVGEFCDGSGIDDGMPQDFTVLQIPLIKQGGNIGCGVGIFFAPHVVEPKTSAVLDATYRLLFDLKAEPEIVADGFRNTIGSYLGLHYDSVSITNGTAKVMLKGVMTGPGHCAEPEVREQINQAAFQFDSVNKIEVYLNGKIFDWCSRSDADPSESHCDTTPQYWIDTK